MTKADYQPILELTRGEIVESVQYGAIAIVDASNHLNAWYGDPQLVTYLRSSAKPFQVMPFIEHDGQEAYHLTLKEVALMCASHSGSESHVAVARTIQLKTGVKESDLLCGTHMPGHRPAYEKLIIQGGKPVPNQHNCSGKHTGMVAFARLLSLPYSLNDQRRIANLPGPRAFEMLPPRRTPAPCSRHGKPVASRSPSHGSDRCASDCPSACAVSPWPVP